MAVENASLAHPLSTHDLPYRCCKSMVGHVRTRTSPSPGAMQYQKSFHCFSQP